MIDDALLRRFDLKLELNLPNKTEIRKLIKLVLKDTPFKIDDQKQITKIVTIGWAIILLCTKDSY